MFKRRVFISYANQDKDKAASLASRLEVEGFNVFFARKSMPPGQNFKTVIHRELAKCHAFIVLISEASNNSEWVNTEIDVAFNRYNNRRLKFFIPVVIETGAKLPARIANIHYYDATTGDLQAWDNISTQISKDRKRGCLFRSLAALIILAVFLLIFILWNNKEDVRIIRLLPHPQSDERQNEEITIKNFSHRAVSLKGWKLRDTTGKSWVLGELDTLESLGQPGDQKTIKRNGQSMGLNNAGDTIQLVNAEEKVVHSVVYRQVEEGKEIIP